MEEIWYHLPTILLYFTIPITAGLVGWGTNVMAVKMTFYPIEYVGFPPFGWQGIIPSKSRKMAEKAVDLLTIKLFRMDEQFNKIEPKRVSEEMIPALGEMSRRIIDEVMEAQIPEIWKNSPTGVKERMYTAVEKELPRLVEEIMADVKDNINELVDLKKLTIDILMKDKTLVNQIFLNCGKEEFKFIEKSGLYFGFLFGLIQMLTFYFYNPWWMLPLYGLLIGYATNWIAIKLIFEPRYPKKLGPLAIQGLFLKRQKEVAFEYTEIITARLLTTEYIFEFIIRGHGSEKMALLIKKHIDEVVDLTAGSSKSIINWLAGDDRMQVIKNIVFFRFRQELPITIREVFEYAEKALDIKNTLRERMVALSPEEFEGFLRPAFQEDEFTLIIVGAILGCIAGFLQYFLLFS